MTLFGKIMLLVFGSVLWAWISRVAADEYLNSVPYHLHKMVCLTYNMALYRTKIDVSPREWKLGETPKQWPLVSDHRDVDLPGVDWLQYARKGENELDLLWEFTEEERAFIAQEVLDAARRIGLEANDFNGLKSKLQDCQRRRSERMREQSALLTERLLEKAEKDGATKEQLTSLTAVLAAALEPLPPTADSDKDWIDLLSQRSNFSDYDVGYEIEKAELPVPSQLSSQMAEETDLWRSSTATIHNAHLGTLYTAAVYFSNGPAALPWDPNAVRERWLASARENGFTSREMNQLEFVFRVYVRKYIPLQKRSKRAPVRFDLLRLKGREYWVCKWRVGRMREPLEQYLDTAKPIQRFYRIFHEDLDYSTHVLLISRSDMELVGMAVFR